MQNKNKKHKTNTHIHAVVQIKHQRIRPSSNLLSTQKKKNEHTFKLQSKGQGHSNASYALARQNGGTLRVCLDFFLSFCGNDKKEKESIRFNPHRPWSIVHRPISSLRQRKQSALNTKPRTQNKEPKTTYSPIRGTPRFNPHRPWSIVYRPLTRHCVV
jgi:hypothetical protein